MSLHLLLLMGAFLVLTTAQPPCDPVTEYEKDGKCCNMCGPGTSMATPSSCQLPQCMECSDDEYQDGYTKERLCKRQPYCDPNFNFEFPNHIKTVKTICKCKKGFHCSNEDCTGCLPHSKCEPGTEVLRNASDIHDTECKKCPHGTFSSEFSLSPCKNWTQCEGFVEQEGTATSDRKCGPSRLHIIAICVPLFVCVIVALIVVFQYREHIKKKAKPCIELCQGGEHQPLRETEIKTPVEDNEAEPSLLEASSEGHVTVRGYPVMEEAGKSEHVSRQESQPETCSSF